MSACPIAIKYAKQVEELVAKGMPFDKALRKVRPQYASELKKISRQLRNRRPQ